MSYTHYLTVKDKACIRYTGHNLEYLVQLRMVRPLLEAQMPDVSFTYACRPEYHEYVGQALCINGSNKEYSFCYELIYDASLKRHPVAKMLEDADLEPTKIATGPPRSRTAYVSIVADFPNNPPTDQQIERAVSVLKYKGFNPTVIAERRSPTETRRLAETAGHVIAVGNELLYEAVANGTPTTLIPTGPQAEHTYRMFVASPNVLP